MGGKVVYYYGIDYFVCSGIVVFVINDGMVVIVGCYLVCGGLVVIDYGVGVVSLYFY